MARISVRDRLIAAGLKVMYAQGYNGCSVQDITDAAGDPKGSFYNHFKSKELLALEVLKAYQQLGYLELSADKTIAPVLRIRDYFKRLSRIQKATGYAGGCLMGNFGLELSGSNPRIRKALSRQFADWQKGISAVLREGQENGDVDPRNDPDQIARFLVSAWQGCLLQMKVSKSAAPFDDFFDLVFAVLTPR